jgi:hypothetical protein
VKEDTMNAIHPVTFDIAKVEHAQRQARRERERLVPGRTPAFDSPVTRVPSGARRVAIAAATLILSLMLAGAALATTENGLSSGSGATGGGGCGGGHAVKLLC